MSRKKELVEDFYTLATILLATGLLAVAVYAFLGR